MKMVSRLTGNTEGGLIVGHRSRQSQRRNGLANLFQDISNEEIDRLRTLNIGNIQDNEDIDNAGFPGADIGMEILTSARYRRRRNAVTSLDLLDNLRNQFNNFHRCHHNNFVQRNTMRDQDGDR